jgi:dTDP-4-dehydrorhamnose reductase
MQDFKKILLTGVNGQVGAALQAAFVDTKVIALNRTQLDLTRADEIKRIVREIKPDLIINPAAYTAVDKAESEPELAYAINAAAVQTLAEEAARLKALLVHYSTDYVYDGTKPSAYIETDDTNPLSVYGKSKRAGELAIEAVSEPHLILRTSWVYNATGKNFLNTILKLAAERDTLRVVNDQFGAPTSAATIAKASWQILDHWREDKSGIYHLVNSGETTWHGFAVAILEAYEAQNNLVSLKLKSNAIQVIGTAQYPTPAPRPANSRLSCDKLFNAIDVCLSDWKTALLMTMTAQLNAD